ncbi:MAG: hypothetical protein K0S32_3416 [Bacteroidetes bacterium]|jgi:hypothetical protein|nr:hypothetical protein [Bacteroidota bacterium]
MKKLLLSALCCLTLAGISQEEKAWRFGVQWGIQGNHAKYSGGMEEAHARFHQNPAGNGGFGVVVRYDHNQRWMWLSGVTFNSYGFEYALAENYSLMTPKNRFTSIKSDIGAFEIPAMIHYKFNPNCNNVRWVIGGGFVESFITSQTINKSVSQVADANTNSFNYLNSTTSVNGGNYWMLRWSIAREKMYKRGAILNASFIVNVGFKDIAQSSVNYTIDGKTYNHDFTNNANFVGFRLSYFFRPVHNWQSAAKKHAAAKSATVTTK